MEKRNLDTRDLASLIITILIGLLFAIGGLILVGNQPQLFNDMIIETVAQNGTNQSGEVTIFWSILFFGIPLLLTLDYFFSRRKKISSLKEISFYIGIQIILSIGNLISFLLYGNIQVILLFLSFAFFINYHLNPDKEKEGFALPILIYYALLSCCAIYNFIGGNKILNSNLLIILAIIFDIVLVIVSKKKRVLNKVITFLQIIIPFLLLLYLGERYIYKNEIIYISKPIVSKIFFGSIILMMSGYAIYRVVKDWKNIEELPISKTIFLTTCLTIFAINSVSTSSNGLLVPNDFHHTGEEIISYQQIFGKGQGAYTDYSPVSGLFPVFTGFVLELLGGNYVAFELANSIFMISFSFIVLYLLSKYLSLEDVLLVSIIFTFPNYDRIVFILPTILILMLPKLIQNRNLWLKLWLWLCFLGGIYYPTFGAAVLLGTLPFGLVQFYQWLKSGELKSSAKSIKFYFGWAICLIPLISFIPLLINMAKHIMIYSSQTILADGISVFGQEIPSNFMSYLSSFGTIRTFMYYILHYIIPILFIWIFVILIKKMWSKKKWMETLQSQEFLILSSGLIALTFSYTSTILRNDINFLVARSRTVLMLIGGILLFLYIRKYIKKNVISYIFIGISFGLLAVICGLSINNTSSRFQYAYQVDENYELITKELSDKFPRLGSKGFIGKNQKNTLIDASRAYELLKYDEDLSFIAWGGLGMYYTLDLKTVGQPSLHAAKGYQAHQEIINAIEKEEPVVGLQFTSSLSNYYLYRWILTNDNYIYDSKYKAFLPKKLYNKIYGITSDNKVENNKKDIPLYTTNVGKVSNSLGLSIKTLEKIMTQKDYSYKINKLNNHKFEINLSQSVNGLNADYLYIKFDISKINIYEKKGIFELIFKNKINENIYVKLNWEKNKIEESEKNTMTSVLGTGELLIPLGSNVNWLLNDHNYLEIEILNCDSDLNIQELRFYQLR